MAVLVFSAKEPLNGSFKIVHFIWTMRREGEEEEEEGEARGGGGEEGGEAEEAAAIVQCLSQEW
jgi:hypothetical protein